VLTRWVTLTNFTASAPLPRSWAYSTQNCSFWDHVTVADWRPVCPS
jgi:hypothetical protein